MSERSGGHPGRGRLAIAGALTALVVASACVDESAGPAAGLLTATLVSPNGSEGAAVIVLEGPGLGDVQSVGGTQAYGNPAAGSTRIVLINQDGGTLSFRIAVADTTLRPSWVVEEVAAPDDRLRILPAGYRVDLRP